MPEIHSKICAHCTCLLFSMAWMHAHACFVHWCYDGADLVYESTSYCCALHTLSWFDLLVPSGIRFIADAWPGNPGHVFGLHRRKRNCILCLKPWSVHLLAAMLSDTWLIVKQILHARAPPRSAGTETPRLHVKMLTGYLGYKSKLTLSNDSFRFQKFDREGFHGKLAGPDAGMPWVQFMGEYIPNVMWSSTWLSQLQVYDRLH